MKGIIAKKNLLKMIIYSLVTLVTVGICVYVIFFMYNNVYKTFVYTDEVLSIDENQDISVIDIDRFREIESDFQKKKERRETDVFMDFD